ncbi:hypothetical protein EUX98_g2541 [Antrodiella citrinella]|uniref:HTH cro/C1-type domain-containing protein n=1 Tax=Antrodiella citrinella TaxID=2447956 RepID=A0A4S4N052_9APHY|nr:hypothetical protein EUX98_g2541 [Antrodiella citrinella]
MAPNPQCAALAAAKEKKGWSYAQIATAIGKSEQHVIDICTGKVTPTAAEFDAIAKVLDITGPPPNDSAHATKRTQVVTDKSQQVLENQTAVEGAILNMTTHIPPTMTPQTRPNHTHVTITHVDHENHRVSWALDSMPSWLLRSVRWQSVTPVEGGKAKYESIEVFNGLLVIFIKWFIGTNLKKSFDGMADGLKARAEQSS